MAEVEVKSLCGVINLLGAIYGSEVDVDRAKRIYGLPLGHEPCVVCGGRKPTKQYKKYCSAACRQKDKFIEVACDECGKLVRRYASGIIWHFNNPYPLTGKPQRAIYCSRTCRGKATGSWLGKHFGFGVFPEHSRLGKFKYDREVIKNLLDCGYSAPEISRELGIELRYAYRLVKILNGGKMNKKRTLDFKKKVCKICSQVDQRELRQGRDHCKAVNARVRNGHCTGFDSLRPKTKKGEK